MNNMQAIYQKLQAVLNKPIAVLWLVLFAVLLHAGTTVTGGLYADDYVHKAYFLGNEALEEKGFLKGIGVGELDDLLSDQFNFFDPREDNYQALTEFGMLPWWASDNALLHFFRPLATVTHYIDYHFWPDNTHIMHGVSLVWYVLGLLAIYALYRGVGIDRPVAILALLLVVLDHSIFQVVTWIASRSMLMVIASGFLAVYAYHKSITSRLWYVVAIVALLLAALSAEAVVAICAYLGAYLFTLDKRPWLKRVIHITPFALLIMAWHIYYQAQGYGAYGVDFYIDPGHEPLVFLETAWLRLPGNFFELISGVDVMSGQVRTDLHRIGFAVAGLASFMTFVCLLWPLFKARPVVRFFFLASCLSLIPGLTIALAPRVMILPFVGMAVVFAYIVDYSLQQFWQKGSRCVAYVIATYIVLIHLILSLVLAVMVLANSLTAIPPEKPYGYINLGVEDIADKPVVLLNAYRPFWLAFYAHHLTSAGEPLPASLRVLSSAFYPITVTRTGERELLLTANPAFQYDTAPLTDVNNRAHLHFAYLIEELMGLIRASRDEWMTGELHEFPEMTIRVNSLHKGKPNSLTINLLAENMADYRWSYWRKATDSYEEFHLPETGKSILIEGIFNEKGY